MDILKTVALTTLLATGATMTGCATPATWINRGHPTLEAKSSGLKTCWDDANIIDGKRLTGTLCGAPASGWMGDGEPKLELGIRGLRFMSALASETTKGKEQDFEGKRVLLKCSPVIGKDGKTEIGRDCTATVNDQPLVGATFIFK